MSGLQATIETLSSTSNEAANAVLLEALDGRDRRVREAALEAILNRRNSTSQDALLDRWDQMSERWKEKIASQKSARLAGAVRDAVLSQDPQQQSNGCDAVLWLREYDLIPTLINASVDASNPQSDLTASTLLLLCEQLQEEVAAPRDYRNRRDPNKIRDASVVALEAAVQKFDEHKRPEIVESFLLLARKENSTLRSLLEDASRRVSEVVGDLLATSTRPGVTRLLMEYLEDKRPPAAALQLLSKRSDIPFVRKLLKSIGDRNLAGTVSRNAKKISQIDWLNAEVDLLPALNDGEQAAAVKFVSATHVPEDDKLALLRRTLESGKPGGRRAAAIALPAFQGVEANQLAREALEDHDPEVQATIIRQLRERGVPGAVGRLVLLVDSPHEEVRNAAQECLAEFSFQRYISAFDMLEESVRWSTGDLVRKIDPNTVEELAEELQSSSRMRKLRALKAAPMVVAVDELRNLLIEALGDDDPYARAEAVVALSHSESPSIEQLIREASRDEHVVVREAAEEALQRRSQTRIGAPAPPGAAAAAGKSSSSPPDAQQIAGLLSLAELGKNT